MSPHNTPGVWRNGRRLCVIAVLAIVVAGLTYRELHATPGPQNRVLSYDVVTWASPPSLATMFSYQPTLLALGNSSAVFYPYVVATKMGWNLAPYTEDGVDFVSGADDFALRLDRVPATYRVDYALIDCGWDDFNQPPEKVAAAADKYIQGVRANRPTATIVIVLPFSTTQDSAPLAVTAELRRASEEAGVRVIDPVAQQWFRGVDMSQLVSPDGAHLDDNGETYYADKIVENLRQMGFAQ